MRMPLLIGANAFCAATNIGGCLLFGWGALNFFSGCICFAVMFTLLSVHLDARLPS